MRHAGHGEACHSRSGAWLEARERYAVACRLRERALGDEALRARGALRLLDVGTGLGLNLAAALEALAGTGVALDATTLEREPSVIDRALAPDVVAELPGEVDRWHAPVRRALVELRSARAPESAHLGADGGRLTLLLGDARETLRNVHGTFDAVFLDAFSPRVDPALWEPDFLGEIARRMAPGSWLSTYTVSLAVRARLAAHGLRVGPGAAVGAKRAGTLARPAGDAGDELARFDARTQRRIDRRAFEVPFSGPRRGGADPR